jgi:transposase
VKDIRRATRKQYSAEEKIRIVLDGLRGEHSIAKLRRREGIAESLYYTWSKEFLEAGKRRLAGDIARAATSGEVKDLRREARALKEVVAEQALELRSFGTWIRCLRVLNHVRSCCAPPSPNIPRCPKTERRPMKLSGKCGAAPPSQGGVKFYLRDAYSMRQRANLVGVAPPLFSFALTQSLLLFQQRTLRFG